MMDSMYNTFIRSALHLSRNAMQYRLIECGESYKIAVAAYEEYFDLLCNTINDLRVIAKYHTHRYNAHKVVGKMVLEPVITDAAFIEWSENNRFGSWAIVRKSIELVKELKAKKQKRSHRRLMIILKRWDKILEDRELMKGR